jgi:hypothetical protein
VLADAAPVVDNGPFTLFSPCRDKKKTNNFRKLFLLFYFFYLLVGEKYKRSIIYAPPQFRGSMKHRARRNSFEMCVKLRFVTSFFNWQCQHPKNPSSEFRVQLLGTNFRSFQAAFLCFPSQVQLQRQDGRGDGTGTCPFIFSCDMPMLF